MLRVEWIEDGVATNKLYTTHSSTTNLVLLDFTAHSTFYDYMEPRQKPVEGMTLPLLAKHDKGS